MVAQAALIAAGINFASGFLKGKQEEYEAKVQAKLALNNAAIYRKNAARVRLNGSLNEDMMRKPDDNDGTGNDFGSFGTEYP